MKKYTKIIIGVVVVVGLVVGGVKAVKKARAKDAALPIAKIYPIVVPTFTPKQANVELTLPFLAEVANDKDVKLAPRIAARVLSITPSGSYVKKGEVVVKLDITNIKSSLKSVNEQMVAAQITLENLNATHKRTLDLLKVRGASIEESQKEATMIAGAEANLNALKQKEIELQNNLSYATIISPVNGIIAKTFASKGTLSVPGRPLLAINSKNDFYIMLRVPTDLSVEGVILNNKEYSAMPLGSTFHGLAEYKVYTGNSKLISGDRIKVDVITYHKKGIQLPFNALLNRNGKTYILVVHGKKAVPQEVHILQSAQQGVVVSDNIEGKKLVIAKPDILLKLLSGYALSIKE